MSQAGNHPENRDGEPKAPDFEDPAPGVFDGSADPRNGNDDGAVQPVEDDPEVLTEQLESTRTELAEMREQYMRAVAEVENVRRRSEQEIAKARKFAVEGFASELLAVKDSLDLAASVNLGDRQDPLVVNMHEGLSLTRKQLDTVFEKFGISVLEPEPGDKLNPDLHQAMSLQESAEVAPNHILQVIQKGFTLNERLLRPAMVVVAKAPVS